MCEPKKKPDNSHVNAVLMTRYMTIVYYCIDQTGLSLILFNLNAKLERSFVK